MIPIYEQGQGKGIGHGLDSFLDRFDSICKKHLHDGRAKAFAFIFYDFTDRVTKRILQDQGVFAKLDRLSGSELSLFYLHAGTEHAIERFNNTFLSALGVTETATLPCIVFFRVKNTQIEDVSSVQLENQDLIHGFSELEEVVKGYISGELSDLNPGYRALKWIKSSAQFLGIEVFRAALRKSLEGW